MKQLSLTCDTNVVAEDEATGGGHEADGHDGGRQATAVAVNICHLERSSCHPTAVYSGTGTACCCTLHPAHHFREELIQE